MTLRITNDRVLRTAMADDPGGWFSSFVIARRRQSFVIASFVMVKA